ncbi:MAG: helix-turn-helix domain-containing protein [Acidimicrobiales bacterium]
MAGIALSAEEREEIRVGCASGESFASIARTLGRPTSTIGVPLDPASGSRSGGALRRLGGEGARERAGRPAWLAERAPCDPTSGSRTGGALRCAGEGARWRALGSCSPTRLFRVAARMVCDPLTCAHLESSTVFGIQQVHHASRVARTARSVIPCDPASGSRASGSRTGGAGGGAREGAREERWARAC